MSAIIRKELRENLPFAGLALLALVIVLGLLAETDGRSGASIVGTNMQMLTQFGFAALGLMLGAAQTLREIRLERWSFLVHRPISRTRIFLGKLLSGLVLYLLVCAAIIAGLAWWGGVSGRVAAPFSANMLLPALSDAVGGIAWYIGAMLTCTRRARWYGSRVLPLVVPLIAAVVVALAAQNFLHVVLWYGAAVLVLLPAAWGSFIANGVYEPQPRVARVTQWISVGIGVALMVYLGSGFLSGMLNTIWTREPSSVRINQYVMLRRGDLPVLRASYLTPAVNAVSWTDLQGQPVNLPELSDEQAMWSAGVLVSPLTIVPREELSPWGTGQLPSFRAPERYLRLMTWNNPVNWYYVPARKTVEGYHSSTRRYVGGVGPDGFVTAPQRPTPFEAPLPLTPYFEPNREKPLLADGGTVYQFDLRARKVERVFSAPPGEVVLGVATSIDSGEAQQHGGGVPDAGVRFIATSRAIHVFGPEGEPLFEAPLDADAHTHVGVAFVRDLKTVVLWYQDNWQREQGAILPQRVLKFSLDGELLSDVTLPPLKRVEVEDAGGFAVDPTYAALSPTQIGLVLLWLRWVDHPIDPSQNPGEVRRIVIVLTVTGLICAAAGYLLARRYGRRQGTRLAWAAGGLAFAVPGVLTMLSVPHRPQRVRCPSCGKPRLVNRERCEHCDGRFAAPETDGTEIFG